MTNIPIQPDVGDFRLIDCQCLNAIRLMRESQRYTKGLFSWIGFNKKEILFDCEARAAGETKWNYWKLINLAIEGITSFTIAPLRAASFIGCILASVSILYMIYIVAYTLIYGGVYLVIHRLFQSFFLLVVYNSFSWESSENIWGGFSTRVSFGRFIW